MKSEPISSTGLLLATAASVGNVGFDVTAKKALQGSDFLRSSLKIRSLVAVLLSLIMLGLWLYPPTRNSIAIFRVGIVGLLPGIVLPVLLLSMAMVTTMMLLYYRALQTAPLSVISPLYALTPIFLLLNGYLLFRHKPSLQVLGGVLCIVAGSLQAHWRPHLRSPLATARAFLNEKGVRLMLAACLLASVTNLLDQWLVRHMDVLSYAWLYVVICAICTAGLLLIVRPPRGATNPPTRLLLLASVIDTTVMLLHFGSLNYVDVVVTIAIKRSGMLLSVLAGAYLFKEQRGWQRFSAATVVLMGVLIMYFDLTSWKFLLVCALAVISSVVAIRSAKRADAREKALAAKQSSADAETALAELL